MGQMIVGDRLAPFEIERKVRQRYTLRGVHNILLIAMSGMVGLSGTTTTIRNPIGPIRENAQTRAPLDVMREVVAVGRSHGVEPPEDYAEVRLKLADEVA